MYRKGGGGGDLRKKRGERYETELETETERDSIEPPPPRDPPPPPLYYPSLSLSLGGREKGLQTRSGGVTETGSGGGE